MNIFDYVLENLQQETKLSTLKHILTKLKSGSAAKKSREARRVATQKKLELKRYKHKLQVKKDALKISKSNKAKAKLRSGTPIRVYPKPLKRIESTPKVIEFKPRS